MDQDIVRTLGRRGVGVMVGAIVTRVYATNARTAVLILVTVLLGAAAAVGTLAPTLLVSALLSAALWG